MLHPHITGSFSPTAAGTVRAADRRVPYIGVVSPSVAWGLCEPQRPILCYHTRQNLNWSPLVVQNTPRSERVVYTVGHSNHAQEDFLTLLREHGIEALADVRSAPYSRYAAQFDKDQLRDAVSAAGIRYLYLGAELGGRPDGEEFYGEDGRVDYARVAQSRGFRVGIGRLETGIAEYRVALMCSEEDPAACHRRLLVGRALERRGASMLHIRGDGSVQAETPDEPTMRQLALFGEQERPEWKSIRPVSRGRRPGSSSSR